MNIVWHTQLNSKTGFSEVSEGLLPELVALGIDVAVACDLGNQYPPHPDPLLNSLTQKRWPDHAIHIGCWFVESMHLIKARPRLSLGFLESTKARQNMVNVYNMHMDGLIVFSNFCRDGFVNSGCRIPIHVIQPGVNKTYLRPAVRPLDRPEFVFLSIGVSQDRKNTAFLEKAFHEAFPADSSVRLILKSNHSGDLNWVTPRRNVTTIWTTGAPDCPDYTHQQMYELYSKADCLVHPSKGEGLGMALLEAAGTGLPSIFTNWSSPAEVFDSSNSFPCRVARLEPAYKFGAQWGRPESPEDCGDWAIIDGDEFKRLMQYVVLTPGDLMKRGNKAAETAGRMTWKRSAEQLIERIKHYVA